ncbi:unnamed protein product, partial [Urochloa humidicola]
PRCPIPWADKGACGGHTKSRGRGLAHGSLSLAYPALPHLRWLRLRASSLTSRTQRGCSSRLVPRVLLPTNRSSDRERMAAAPSYLACSPLSRLAAPRSGAAAAARAPAAPQQLRLGCSRRRAQRVVAMAGSGKFFVGGNWKCNGTKDSISKLVSELNAATLESDVDVVVAPPFIYIDQVKNSLTDRIEVSAQNVWIGKGGAYTGEISAEQLVDIGCQWVILGHSERRNILGEDDEFIGKKAAYALSQNVKVIACIGELLEEREAGKTFDVCFKQLKAYADSISNWTDVVIAYEPVWAIGTGKVATPEQAQEVHAAVL